MNPQLKVEEETGQESRVTMSEGRNTAGGTSDGGVAPRSSVTVSCHEVTCPPDTFITSKQTVRPGHFTSKESDPLRSRLSPLQGDILLRSKVSGRRIFI